MLYADYNGVVRARKLCEDAANSQHYWSQPTAVTAGYAYTVSFKAKAAEKTQIVYTWNVAGTAFAAGAATFNLSAGTVTPSGAATGTITALGNGWYLCTTTNVCTTTSAASAHYWSFTGLTTYVGDGTSGIYLTDNQVELGSTVQAYNDTTSAAYYGPRFDYDPTNLVRQNLLLYSQAFDDAAWGGFDVSHIVSANSAIAPDGTLTADAWTWPASTTNFGFNAQTITGNASQAYTYSVWVRLQTGAKNIRLKISNVTVATLTSANINLTTTWQRISYSIPANALAQTTQVGVAFELGSSSSVGAGDIIELWGAQLNIGSTALTYTATTTAPYTLCAARGLLIEEQRANLLLQSNDFLTSWTPTNITRTLASTTGPDGTLSGVKIEATAALSTVLFQSAIVAATAATASVYVKQGTGASVGNEFTLRNGTTLTNLVRGTLNYTTGVFTYTVGSTGVTVTNTGNGWWRITMSASAGITSGDSILWYVGWGGQTATAGDFLYAYGAQLEAGTFATSYIPTVSSQVTRSADISSIATLTPWFNANAGTIVANATEGIGSFPSLYTFEQTSAPSANRIYAYRDSATATASTNLAATIYSASVNVANLTQVATNTIRSAVAYAANDFAISINGATPFSSGSGATPVGMDKFWIGWNNPSVRSWNGHIQAISYYPTRLPNATLQGLTV